MILTTRPLADRSWLGVATKHPSQFTATWSDTLDLLEREVYAIQSRGMADPVLMLDITEDDLRIDGQIRANARPSSDAVALSIDSDKGPLIFRCDRFDRKPYGARMTQLWQHHVRAIALTLEALRKVDRYGATQSDEQYAGWRQIASTAAVVTESPRAVLAELAGLDRDVPLERLIAVARRNAHPDRGGSPEAWARFDTAWKAVQ